jgi:hypothetical protein
LNTNRQWRQAEWTGTSTPCKIDLAVSKEQTMKRKRGKTDCPVCHSSNVLPYMYGLPNAEAAQEAKQGKLLLGGCCISEESPHWHCRDCEYEWGRIEDE